MAEQLPDRIRGKQLHKLFSVMGSKLEARTIELIIASSEINAKDYAVRELGFDRVESTSLVSDCVHVATADTKG